MSRVYYIGGHENFMPDPRDVPKGLKGFPEIHYDAKIDEASILEAKVFRATCRLARRDGDFTSYFEQQHEEYTQTHIMSPTVHYLGVQALEAPTPRAELVSAA